MKNLTKENEITSLELLKEINLFREQEYYYKIEDEATHSRDFSHELVATYIK